MTRRFQWLAGAVALGAVAAASGQAQNAPRTRVIVLGVAHAGQLVSEGFQPAAFRAFYDRVRPAAIAIERSPEQFARNDHYEFTYEIQYLTVPYAREHGVALHGFDWYPSLDDQILGFGVDLDAPPILRPAEGFQSFVFFADSADLRRTLFYADAPGYSDAQRRWQSEPATPANRDMARRLFLYRTFMQARHIERIAANYRGKTVLVVVGDQHKPDLEAILGANPAIEIVLPSTFGMPTPAAIAAAVTEADRYAIASFNLLGIQSMKGPVDWPWLERIVADLGTARSPEVELLTTRLRALRGTLNPADAAAAYARIAMAAGPDTRFTWTGVKDGRRIDSWFDPFGNLGVAPRAMLEQARESYRAGRPAQGDSIRNRLAARLTAVQRAQLDGYWTDFVMHHVER